MKPQYLSGDEVFVRYPQRFVTDCVCIIGMVIYVSVLGEHVRFEAEIGRIGKDTNTHATFTLPASDIMHRLGTPISAFNGNAMTRHQNPAAWDNWLRLSNSWGHP